MSRIGKSLIKTPAGVNIDSQGSILTVKGKNGVQTLTLPKVVRLEKKEDICELIPEKDDQKTRSLWGTYNRLLRNAIEGVSEGFKIDLEINGVGYRASIKGKNLVMQLGYSHDVVFPIPEDIQIKCEKPTSISVTGISKQRVGQISAEIRSKRLPEPYKGKGIKYSTETIRRKEGKKK